MRKRVIIWEGRLVKKGLYDLAKIEIINPKYPENRNHTEKEIEEIKEYYFKQYK